MFSKWKKKNFNHSMHVLGMISIDNKIIQLTSASKISMLNKESYLGSGHENGVTHLEFAWSNKKNYYLR